MMLVHPSVSFLSFRFVSSTLHDCVHNVAYSLNARICKEAVTKYKVKWSKMLEIDRRVLNEWEKKVHEAIDESSYLGLSMFNNKRRKHVL